LCRAPIGRAGCVAVNQDYSEADALLLDHGRGELHGLALLGDGRAGAPRGLSRTHELAREGVPVVSARAVVRPVLDYHAVRCRLGL